MRYFAALFAPLLIAACTSVTVKPIDPALGMRHVCIQNNPEVEISDFIQVLQSGFQRHDISTEVFSGQRPPNCEFVLTYIALRSWDVSTYLSRAELAIDQNGHEVAHAEYYLRGKGGLSLTKWASTKEKMDPVIDELLGP